MIKRLIISMALVNIGGVVSAETAPTQACAIEADLCQKMVSQFIAFSDGENSDFVVTMPFEVIPSVSNETCSAGAPSAFAFSGTWGPTLESNRRFYFAESEGKTACFLSGFGSDALRHSGKAGVAIGSLESLRTK